MVWDYGMGHREDQVIDTMRHMQRGIMQEHGHNNRSEADVGSSSLPRVEDEKGQFMIDRHEADNSAWQEDRNFGLHLYLTGRFKPMKYEATISYWKRQSADNKDMQYSVGLARQELALPASSINVERGFSQIGCVTTFSQRHLLPETLMALAGVTNFLKKSFVGQINFEGTQEHFKAVDRYDRSRINM